MVWTALASTRVGAGTIDELSIILNLHVVLAYSVLGVLTIKPNDGSSLFAFLGGGGYCAHVSVPEKFIMYISFPSGIL